MELLRSKYTFEISPECFVSNCPQAGTHITILHANKVPPHIGLLIDGYFFSLKAKGKDQKVPVEWLNYSIHQKQIPTIFVEINANQKVTLEQVQTHFLSLPNEIPNNTTCLTPLLFLLKAPDQIICVADLLLYLAESDQIKRHVGMHLPHSFSELPIYGEAEIHARIKDLKNV